MKVNYVLDISLGLLISIIAGNVYKPLRLESLCGPIIRIPGPSKQVIINKSQMASRKFHPVSRIKNYCLKSWRYYKHTYTNTHIHA